jgi:CRISPR system Cascade subunit CasC
MPEERNTFVEFHALTSHVPANLNRDELGTPKTAIFGGERRLRISSQCLKRTWRTSEFFRGEFAEAELGLRTKHLPEMVLGALEKGTDISPESRDGLVALLSSIGKKNAKADEEETEDEADDSATDASTPAGDAAEARTAHLLFLSRQEIDAVVAFARERATQLSQVFEKSKKGAKKVSSEKLNRLRDELGTYLKDACVRNAVDVSLFGRFVTSDEIRSVDAAMQVAHALGTQAIKIEYDYFSAVDDQQPKGEQGAGHIGEAEFGASVFYKYAVCDMNQLVVNLNGDRSLAARSMKAIAQAIARSVPTGKKNSTAPQNPADYLAVIVRQDAPVSLANAFLKPVRPERDADVMDVSISRLHGQATRYAKAYGEPGRVLAQFVLDLREGEIPEGWTACESLTDLSGKVEEQLKGEGGA